MKNDVKQHFVTSLTLTSYLAFILSWCSAGVYGIQTSTILEGNPKNNRYTRADEYFSEIYQGEILVPVNLLGAVGRPGVYHVPKQTDIVRLLALAGGTRADANLEDVTIRRRTSETERSININLKQVVEERGLGKPINLEANDIVLVAPKEPLISSNTLQAVGFVSSLLGLVVSSIVIVNQLKK